MPLGINKPANVPGSATPAIVIGIFVAFGGILFGYDTGSISGILANNYFKKEFATQFVVNDDGDQVWDFTAGQKSLMVSILSLGTFFGALASAPFGDFFGRRMGLVWACVVFILGIIFQTAATAIPLFTAGRVFAGFGVGLVSALVPLYQSESAPKWIRGTIVSAYQFAITIGIFLAACVNKGTENYTNTGAYRVPVAVQFAWALILIAGMLFLPETPRYLIKRDDMEGAAKSLARLRRLPVDHESIKEEIAEIRANHEFELTLGTATYLDCFRGTNFRRVVHGTVIQALQQLTGVNFIFYYGTNFFKQSGIKDAFLIGLITALVNVFSTLPGMYLVERIGRRKLLIMGAAGMCVTQFIVAIVGVTTENVTANKVLIAFVCFYIFFFASTWGPCCWVYIGEIFPLKIRAKGLSLGAASNWLWNFAIAYATPYLVDPGKGNADLGVKIFFIWGSCCFLCLAFAFFVVVETKGLSLEEVDQLFESGIPGYKSTSFVPTAPHELRNNKLGATERESVEAATEKPVAAEA